MWFTKWRLNRKKDKFLSKLKPNDKIYINCPEGYVIIINEDLKLEDYPTTVEIVSNDVEAKKLWIRFDFKNNKILKTLRYSSDELRNYMLYNIYSVDFKANPVKKKLSKTDLEKQLKEAIESGNFESAALINEELKNIND